MSWTLIADRAHWFGVDWLRACVCETLIADKIGLVLIAKWNCIVPGKICVRETVME